MHGGMIQKKWERDSHRDLLATFYNNTSLSCPVLVGRLPDAYSLPLALLNTPSSLVASIMLPFNLSLPVMNAF